MVDTDPKTHVHIERVISVLKLGPAVADRIRKLNPEWIPEYQRVRGLHMTLNKERMQRLQLHYTPLGSAIREHGREILDFIPKHLIQKFGKRKHVPTATLLKAINWTKAEPDLKQYGRRVYAYRH